MADYDVGAVSLSVPPTSAVIQAYRPAVLVRNNGAHDALAVGSLRIYSPAGLLIFTTAIYSGVIAPGETTPAQAVDYWTPPALGKYMFIATVTCINDQFEPNNNLAPCFVDVIPGEPTPPSAVPLHAAQHEEGGSDEVIIDGLHGRTADPQIAIAHKTTHGAAGSDELDLTGLHGILADGQPIADHHATHEDGGDDELNVEGLSGELHNLQKPKTHDNSAHDPNYSINKHGSADHSVQYATDADLDTHKLKNQVHGTDPYHVLSDYHTTEDPAPHSNATNLEKTANKGQIHGYAELDASALVPRNQLAPDIQPPPQQVFLSYDRTWVAPIGAAQIHHLRHENGGDDEVSIAGLSGKAADAQDPVAHKLSHQTLGPDELNVTNLHGVLADPQPLSAHKTSHQVLGSDEISVNGLHGILADPQPYTPVNHAPSHEAGGGDQLSILNLHGIAADAQTPIIHGAAMHSNAPPVLAAIDGSPAEGTSTFVSRADHVHNSPGCIFSLQSEAIAAGGIGEAQLAVDIPCSIISYQGNIFWRALGFVKYGGLGTSTATIFVRFGSAPFPSAPIAVQMDISILHLYPYADSPFELTGVLAANGPNYRASIRILRDAYGCTPTEVSHFAVATTVARPLSASLLSFSASQPLGVGAEIHFVTLTVERLRLY
jgi:hypothetical protein